MDPATWHGMAYAGATVALWLWTGRRCRPGAINPHELNAAARDAAKAAMIALENQNVTSLERRTVWLTDGRPASVSFKVKTEVDLV